MNQKNMNLKKAIKPYLLAFFLLGQSPFPFKRTKRNHYFIMEIFLPRVPVLIFGFLSITFTILAVATQPRYIGRFAETNIAVGYIYIASCSITSCMVVIQCIFYAKILLNIQKSFFDIEHVFGSKLSITLCFQEFKRKVLIKIFVIVIAFMQAVITFIIATIILGEFMVSPYTYAIQFLIDIACVHAIFYVHMVYQLLSEINKVLKNDNARTIATVSLVGTLSTILRSSTTSNSSSSSSSSSLSSTSTTSSLLNSSNGNVMNGADNMQPIEKLIILRQLHLDLYKISEKINYFFGWFFIAYIIQHFIDLAYDLYWLFLVNQYDQYYLFIQALSFFICAATSTIVLVNSCEYCAQEANKMIGNVLQTKNPHKDEYFTIQKQEFLYQINQQIILTSAKGFFIINRKFLAGLATACCTYVIILIQFQISLN